MNVASQVITAFVAALHGYFLVLEMFLWATPFGARTFGRPLEEMQRTRTLAANQGLYNGFLAAGLVWSLITGSVQVRIFFLACVLIAGVSRRAKSRDSSPPAGCATRSIGNAESSSSSMACG